jgi:hypothetical protein
MATLREVQKTLETDRQRPASVSLAQIVLYIEVVALIVSFIMDKGIIRDGKVSIKFTHWFAIIGLFRQVIKLLSTDLSEK